MCPGHLRYVEVDHSHADYFGFGEFAGRDAMMRRFQTAVLDLRPLIETLMQRYRNLYPKRSTCMGAPEDPYSVTSGGTWLDMSALTSCLSVLAVGLGAADRGWLAFG